jgi:hypothetical protein
LGAEYLVVLCAGPTLLLAKQSLDEAPYKLSGAVTKLAGISFGRLAFSYWNDIPWFLTEGKFADVLIISSSWGSQLDGDLYQHRHNKQHKFSGAVAREKEDFYKGSFTCTSFTLFIISLYFIFTCIILSKNTKKISFLLVVFTCLLLALLEWVLMRTPSCVILLALIIVTLSALLLRHLLLLLIFMRLNLLY